MQVRLVVPLVALGLAPGCAGPPPTPPLTGTQWTLIELDGAPAPLGARDRPATLELAPDARRAGGFAGCNQFGGGYDLADSSLKFTALALTRMACDAGLELERRYTDALQVVGGYRLTGRHLELVGPQGVVAVFQAP